MAFLSILFLLFSFVFLGVGSSSSSMSDVPLGTSSSSGHGSAHPRHVLKCSARMSAGGQPRQRCGPPPANP
jgi:hypothetical protein